MEVMKSNVCGKQCMYARTSRSAFPFYVPSHVALTCFPPDFHKGLQVCTPPESGHCGHLQAMESASETYEQRKKSLEAQNAQMLIEIHEYESIRSQLQQMVVEETILAEQAQEEDSDDEDDEVADEAEQKHVAGSETESKPADN